MAGYLLELASLIPQVARLLDPESVALTGVFWGGNQVEMMEGANRIWGLGFGNFELGFCKWYKLFATVIWNFRYHNYSDSIYCFLGN